MFKVVKVGIDIECEVMYCYLLFKMDIDCINFLFRFLCCCFKLNVGIFFFLYIGNIVRCKGKDYGFF